MPSICRAMKQLSAAALLIGAIMVMPGCKTTEKNYSEAYEVARAKQQRDAESRSRLDSEVGIDRSQLHDADAPIRRRIGYTIPEQYGGGELEAATRHIVMRRADSIPYASACVAIFKMKSNAASMAERLSAEGYPGARVGSDADAYYVLIDAAPSVAPLAPAIRKFIKENPDFNYVGIPELTILINR